MRVHAAALGLAASALAGAVACDGDRAGHRRDAGAPDAALAGDVGPPPVDAAAPPSDAGAGSLELRFERVPGGRDFDVVASVVDATGAPVAGPAVELAVSRGTLGAPAREGTTTRARVTADGTGHHVVTARAGALEARRVALVLGEVDDAWGQPEPVPGLVNTAGWEDGASVSPDGERLTVQYLPVAIDCVLGGDPAAPACAVRGPVDAPERPGMPGAERVRADGTYLNGCPTLGVPELPLPVPPNALYAFERAADDAFGAPRPLYFDGADGCLSAFGLELQDDGVTAVFAFDDPRPPDTGGELFRATIDPSGPVVLGRFVVERGVLGLRDALGLPLGEVDDGPQGNPHETRGPAGALTVLFDDEQGRQDLFFLEETPAGAWSPQRRIPEPVSVAGAQESQPFLADGVLLFRRDLVVLGAAWNGGPLDDAGSWAEPRTVLAPAASGTREPGEVVVVGEPSVTVARSPRELYFVYGRREDDGSLGLDVGRVTAR